MYSEHTLIIGLTVWNVNGVAAADLGSSKLDTNTEIYTKRWRCASMNN